MRCEDHDSDVGAELISESRGGQARHKQLLCDYNHINKNDFISVQFVTKMGKVHYVGRIEGNHGTAY
jgi:hypothetical protein